MNTIYPAVLYDRSLPIGSFWETTVDPFPAHRMPPLEQDVSCDVAVIGGGITGLSAALHLAKQGQQVCLLEAGTPGWGASGRNGGFCCIGATHLSKTELLQRFGQAETRQFFQVQREAIHLVRQLAEDYDFAIDPQGEGEIEVAHRPSRWAELQKAYTFYREVADFPCQLWSRDELAERGLPSPEFHGALWQGVGFGLNPLKYSLGLAAAACDQGVSVYAHSPVEAWEKGGDGYHRLQTPGGVVRSPQVIIATNAYTTENLHPSVNGCVMPILSQIFTTRPLTPEELAEQGWHTDTPIYDSRQTLYYFRILPDGRFLIGTRGDMWGTGAAHDRITEKMHRHFQRMFPAWREVEISHVWNGLLGATRALAPHIGVWPEDPTVFYALAYHGNGVAAATWSGRAAAHLATQHLHPDDLCAPFRQPLQAFPLPSLRLWYLRSACLAYQIQDEFL